MGLFDNIFKDSSQQKRDDFPAEVYQHFRTDEGKNIVVAIHANTEFPTPPFKGPIKKAQKDNQLYFSKMLNGIMSVTQNSLVLNNSAAVHKPKFDLGYEIELDYIATLMLHNNQWSLKYFDKQTSKTTKFPFVSFVFLGGQ